MKPEVSSVNSEFSPIKPEVSQIKPKVLPMKPEVSPVKHAVFTRLHSDPAAPVPRVHSGYHPAGFESWTVS